jgi:23S rRNA pseudouridine2605 synthase
MRINKYIAQATGLSRRKADELIAAGRVSVDGLPAEQGMDVTASQQIRLDERAVTVSSTVQPVTIRLNKPVGYVCSRNGQGSKTIYDLLPSELHSLKPVGRLDKDSSGLLLLTGDGQLAHDMTHPSRQKIKVYEVTLDKPLQPLHRQMISDHGVMLEDGVSKFELARITGDSEWQITMHEGRNRQIRRTFAALGYTVTGLNRVQFGDFQLEQLEVGRWQKLDT